MSHWLTTQSILMCPHAGAVTKVAAPRVTILGAPVLTKPALSPVVGCSLASAPSGPCATASFPPAPTRVTVDGAAVLLSSDLAQCTFQSGAAAGPALVVVFQQRVTVS